MSQHPMSRQRKVLVYGAGGYTGKIIAQSLAQRNIPFFMAGRDAARLAEAKAIVEQRHGGPIDAQLAVASTEVEALRPWFDQVDIVINVAGPFMQLGWPIVATALACNCHYLDTTGEQDWSLAIRNEFGQAFADKGLLLSPANSYMWAAGAIAAEVVLETAGVDSLDLLYQIDNGLPSQASTKSFLRMVCNETSQYFLDQNELKPWPIDQKYSVCMPHRNRTLSALPWGGGNEPIWYLDDPRVRNCSVLTAIGEHIIDGVLQAIGAFMEQAAHLPPQEREAWTNAVGVQMTSDEPPKDSLDVQRSVIVCR